VQVQNLRPVTAQQNQQSPGDGTTQLPAILDNLDGRIGQIEILPSRTAGRGNEAQHAPPSTRGKLHGEFTEADFTRTYTFWGKANN
jgi:hypothetical protein